MAKSLTLRSRKQSRRNKRAEGCGPLGERAERALDRNGIYEIQLQALWELLSNSRRGTAPER